MRQDSIYSMRGDEISGARSTTGNPLQSYTLPLFLMFSMLFGMSRSPLFPFV